MFIIHWHLLLFIPVTLLLVLVPSIPDPQLLVCPRAELGDSNVSPLGGESLILVQVSVPSGWNVNSLNEGLHASHLPVPDPKSENAHLPCGTKPLLFASLPCLFTFSWIFFFFFNARRDKYCAQFHQAVTGVRK